MSTIRKKPFIEYAISSLDSTMKQALVTALNTNATNQQKSFADLPAAGVTPVQFTFDANNVKNGIFVRNSTYCFVIAYHRFQDVQIYRIDLTKNTYEKLNEYCDINELRRLLMDDVVESAWEAAIKDHLVYSATDSQVEVGTDIEIDGDVKVNGLENITNTDGTELFWTGTQAEYDALTSYNDDTVYIITAS